MCHPPGLKIRLKATYVNCQESLFNVFPYADDAAVYTINRAYALTSKVSTLYNIAVFSTHHTLT